MPGSKLLMWVNNFTPQLLSALFGLNQALPLLGCSNFVVITMVSGIIGVSPLTMAIAYLSGLKTEKATLGSLRSRVLLRADSLRNPGGPFYGGHSQAWGRGAELVRAWDLKP